MFGLATDTFLLLDALVTIVGLILLITHFKVHPFVALTLAAGFLGLTSGMPVAKVMKSFQDGFGGVLGFVGIVLALGTMLGKLMADSGGADQIAQTLIRAFGKKNVHWAMMFAAFLVGIPLFFEIGFVLLIPLVFIVARRSGVSLVKIGIPLLAGLSVVHGLVPPHPGPLLAIGIFNADIGKTIFYGLIVALPTAIIAGPLYGNFISRYIPGNPSQELMDQIAKAILPPGTGFEWTGMAYQENIVGNQLMYVFALAILLVYLCLAGQYESWVAPLAVILAVPLALSGPAIALTAVGLANNIYTQIGLMLLIALGAKNAILIVEVARERRLIDGKERAELLKAQGLETLAVAMQYDVPAYVMQFAQSRQLPFRVAMDHTGEIAQGFGPVQLTPTTLVIDKKGKIVKRYIGEPDFAAMHELIGKLLADQA